LTQLVKVTPVENLFFSINNADPSRPQYHNLVYQYGRQIFIMLQLEDKYNELNILVRKEIEMPMKADYQTILDAYYDNKFLFSKKAFCKIGDPIEPIYVSRYEIGRRLQKITQWILDNCSELSNNVRFYSVQNVQR
jgi:hypothetical protein